MISATFFTGRWTEILKKKWSVYVADSVVYFASNDNKFGTLEFRERLE